MKNCFLFLLLLFSPIFLMGQFKELSDKELSNEIVVVLDAGHGGNDPGKLASSKKYKNEKDINLLITKKIGTYLSKVKNIKVIYTRKGDITQSLDKRVKIANKNNADVFLSIHCNSARRKNAQGASFHIHMKECSIDYKLAQAIEEDFVHRVKRPVFGIKDYYDRGRNLQVIQYVNMPAVIIEVGFLSNAEEEKYLNTEEGQTYVASGVYRGVKKYIFENMNDMNTCRENIYKVQILASRTPIPSDNKLFKKLNMRVEQYLNDNSQYKYKYIVGHEYELKKILKLKKKIVHRGFEDAFIITLQDDKKNSSILSTRK